MNAMDQVRYASWRLALWDRGYGTYVDIDRDAGDGKLISGTMPDRYWREGDRWPKQSEVKSIDRGVLDMNRRHSGVILGPIEVHGSRSPAEVTVLLARSGKIDLAIQHHMVATAYRLTPEQARQWASLLVEAADRAGEESEGT